MEISRFKLIVTMISGFILLITFSCKMKPEQMIEGDSGINKNIRLSDAQIQLANINTAEAREGSIGRKLSLTGVLKVNEQSAITISARVPGRIEKLFFKNTGETVAKGEKLYEFYSDDLISVQREYFTLQSNNWNFTRRYEPSLALENKLLIMGMIPSQIQQLAKDGKILFTVTIYSPASGKIRSVNVSEGQYVAEGQQMFELAEDSNLWVEAQVYPDEIKFLKPGMPANVKVPAAGEFTLNSRISFINPSFEAGKNITLVRAVIRNPESKLYPGMFAIMDIQTQSSHGIIIPSSAIISGTDGDRVWVMEENGEFSGRVVTTGLQSGDSVLVLSGIDKPEKIVTSGAYLLNSEFILKQGSSISREVELARKKEN
jgi:membrane fusion protein, copper/silver efflux system